MFRCAVNIKLNTFKIQTDVKVKTHLYEKKLFFFMLLLGTSMCLLKTKTWDQNVSKFFDAIEATESR